MYDDRRNDFNLSTIIGPNASRCVQRRPVASRRDAYGRILACIWWQWPGFLHPLPSKSVTEPGRVISSVTMTSGEISSSWRYRSRIDARQIQETLRKLIGFLDWCCSASPPQSTLFILRNILFICSEFPLWLINHAIYKSNKNINQITKQSK